MRWGWFPGADLKICRRILNAEILAESRLVRQARRPPENGTISDYL
jgi:hypothetical protein